MSLLVRAWVPTRTLSSTERLANRATFWKVRPMPISAMRCGGRDKMLSPSIRMSPALGWYSRDRQLNSVVLPAPFGPIRPRIWPLLHVERHAVQRDDAAEHDADVANREQGAGNVHDGRHT